MCRNDAGSDEMHWRSPSARSKARPAAMEWAAAGAAGQSGLLRVRRRVPDGNLFRITESASTLLSPFGLLRSQPHGSRTSRITQGPGLIMGCCCATDVPCPRGIRARKHRVTQSRNHTHRSLAGPKPEKPAQIRQLCTVSPDTTALPRLAHLARPRSRRSYGTPVGTDATA